MSHPRPFICGTILFVGSVALYLRACSFGFVNYDDGIYIYGNPHVYAGMTKESIVYAFTTFDSGNWIPLTWLSYMLDTTLFGFSPASFHIINIVLHGFNGALLFLWLNRISNALWRSFAVAALFAVHPLHVESVAWISERKDVLSACCFLCMLHAYDYYSHRASLRRYSLVIICYTLGLLSKPMLVTAPMILWLVDLWPGSNWSKRNEPNAMCAPSSFWMKIADKTPLLLLALVTGLITIRAQESASAFSTLETIPLFSRFGNAVISYAWYVAKTFVPTGLCAVYSHPILRLSWMVAGLSAFFLSGVCVFVALRFRRYPFLAFGWMWYGITLLPVIGLLQVGYQSRADRYTYIPQIGLWIAIVWQGELWLRKIPGGGRLANLAVGMSVVVFGVMTVRQIGFWKDTEALWTRALAVSTENWEAHRQLGMLLLAQKQFDESYRHIRTAIEMNPGLQFMFADLGSIHQAREEWSDAGVCYEKCLLSNPDHVIAMHNLVKSLKQQNRAADAIPYLLQYLRWRSADSKMRIQLRLICADAVKTSIDDIPSKTNLGLALSELGRLNDARVHLEAVVSAEPKNLNARLNIGSLLARMGLKEEAMEHLEVAITINPNDQEARLQLERLNSVMAK